MKKNLLALIMFGVIIMAGCNKESPTGAPQATATPQVIATATATSATIATPIIKFEQNYGGTGSDGGNSIQQTSDSGYVIAGYTDSTGIGNADAYLIKTDASGNSN